MVKLAIIMAGGGASGKTTTRKAFALGKPQQHFEITEIDTIKGLRSMRVMWTIYDNCALVGNHNSGTDNASGPGSVKHAFFKCLESSDVVIVDGKITSPQWVLMCNRSEEHTSELQSH